jgi:hypothetical protein
MISLSFCTVQWIVPLLLSSPIVVKELMTMPRCNADGNDGAKWQTAAL